MPLVVLVGNPNVGKTTLFNCLTGQNARVGNYPGVTVERRFGRVALDEGGVPIEAEVADIPGAYSLSARSPEEHVTLGAVLGIAGHPRPDLVVAVVDSGQLVRNLYLVLQLAELRVPLLIVLNMMDEASARTPRPAAVGALFGVPCVATDARHGFGIDALRSTIRTALADPPRPIVSVPYPDALRADMDRLGALLPERWRGNVERERALALWSLSSLGQDELEGIEPHLRAAVDDVRSSDGSRDLEREIIATRYAWLDRHAADLFGAVRPARTRTLTDRIDGILLHPILGFALFVLAMLGFFQALFSWSDPAIAAIEGAVSISAHWASRFVPAGWLRDLVSGGVIGGVGNVLVFLPQILLLFLFLGFLEDSGYMARVAFLMDRIMKGIGLHGRAFVPMLSGFACAVPAVLATRTMERPRDRLLTMMVIPLMTCSARLPVYTLIVGALFSPDMKLGGLPVQGLLMVAMYLFSVTVTLLAAAVLGRTVLPGRRVPLILELPPYRVPRMSGVLKMVWERSTAFVREAGTVILVCTLALWALLYFPRPAQDELTPQKTPIAGIVVSTPENPSGEPATASSVEQSYGGRLGKALEPVLSPLGFDWRIGIGIIGAFSAREVFISTMALVYGIDAGNEETAALRDRLREERGPGGTPVYRPLVGISLMIFFALSCQCMSTLAVVRRETKSWRWPAFLFGYMTFLAYLASLLVYQVGTLVGF
jgi:ferrous iron transport protein B